MPEWEAFYFHKFFLKWELDLYLKNRSGFRGFVELIELLFFDNPSHAKVLALYLQS